MGYEMEIRCEGCGDASPSLKMFRANTKRTAQNLGVWIYEHAHCLDTVYTTQGESDGWDLPPLRFTRIVEDDELYPINKEAKWRYPVTERVLNYLDELEFKND